MITLNLGGVTRKTAVLRFVFMKQLWFIPFVILFVIPLTVFAQDPTPTPTPDTAVTEPLIPLIHTVQEGENLTIIATNFGVTVEDILLLNGLTNGDVLALGQELIIPGAEGEAIATVYTAQAGDSLDQIAAVFGTTSEELIASNKIINPNYKPILGQSFNVVSLNGSPFPQPITGTPHVVGLGETLPMIAAQHNISTTEIIKANHLSYPTYLYPGQRLQIPSGDVYRHLEGEWVDVQIRPYPIQQGSTVSIYVENILEGLPSAKLAGQTLRFFPNGDGYSALVGIDAFTKPDIYELELTGSGSRPWRPLSQPLHIANANYSTQAIVLGEEYSALLAPEVRANEDVFLSAIYTQFTDEQAWEGVFQFPVTTTIVTGPYGDGRSYNGGPVEIYHTGVDFSGAVGTPILAPANGTIVFTGPLELRGNAVIIDHGLGVMSAYFHLSEIFVNEGEQVIGGQPIGAGGSTGLSTGPHLHWDLRIMDVPVNGLQWTETTFP